MKMKFGGTAISLVLFSHRPPHASRHVLHLTPKQSSTSSGFLLSRFLGSSPPSSYTGPPASSSNPSGGANRQDLVILGTGWGSYSVLRNIKRKKHLRERFNIIVISPRNHFLFTPLLASTTVGMAQINRPPSLSRKISLVLIFQIPRFLL